MRFYFFFDLAAAPADVALADFTAWPQIDTAAPAA
jgi:hypothetical protein